MMPLKYDGWCRGYWIEWNCMEISLLWKKIMLTLKQLGRFIFKMRFYFSLLFMMNVTCVHGISPIQWLINQHCRHWLTPVLQLAPGHQKSPCWVSIHPCVSSSLWFKRSCFFIVENEWSCILTVLIKNQVKWNNHVRHDVQSCNAPKLHITWNYNLSWTSICTHVLCFYQYMYVIFLEFLCLKFVVIVYS